jgi:cysteine-rich repeat protein
LGRNGWLCGRQSGNCGWSSSCGNGIQGPDEACGDGNSINGDGCDNNCTLSACGNGIVTAGEQCDDGNTVNGDGCEDNCTTSRSLEVSKSGTGNGTVTANPTEISCGADCSELYRQGTTVTLTATADGDSTFTGWSGGGCTGTCNVAVDSATLVTANFVLAQYDLTVATSGTGTG